MTYQSDISGLMAALGDPTRRAIVEHLAGGASPVGEIAATLPVSRPAVSQHLKVLSDAGLVTAKPDGTRRIYTLRPDAIADLRAWCDGLWEDALQAFTAKALHVATIEKDVK